MPNIVGCLRVLDEMSEFFREEEEAEKEFSQYGDNEEIPCTKTERCPFVHFVHTEDDSIVKQTRGY